MTVSQSQERFRDLERGRERGERTEVSRDLHGTQHEQVREFVGDMCCDDGD